MTQTHTKAPWELHGTNSAGNMQITGDGKDVACVYAPEWGYDAPSDIHECKANARLMTAAPELLEALEWAVQHTPVGAARDRVQRIIIKARGQA